MAVKVSYPGVYIDEFAPGAPIQPAGTNTAAILGPLAKGPIVDIDVLKQPMLVTSFDQFQSLFGTRPAPGFFTWFAVQGFFQNGGTAVYVYRVTNAAYAKANLTNADGVVLGKVIALQAAALATPIQFVVKDSVTPLLPAGTKLFAATAAGTLAGTKITIPDGGDPGAGPPKDVRAFRVGDWVQVSDANGNALGAMARVISATPGTPTGTMVVDEQFDAGPVQVKLMYDSTGQIRITTPTPLLTGTLGVGATLVLGDPTDPKRVVDVAEAVGGEQLTASFRTYRIALRNGLRDKIDPSAKDVPVSAVTFDVAISQGGTPYVFTNLAPDSASDDYYVDTINEYPSLVRIVAQDPPPPVKTLDAYRPASQPFSVAGGQDENLDTLADNDFIAALDTIRRLPDVRLVSVPDGYPRTTGTPKLTSSVHAAVIAHCEQMADRFAVLDPEPSLDPFGDPGIESRRQAVDSTRGYAALYYPWVRVSPPWVGPLVTVPPSGHICGLMARIDDTRGVFKAPANEILQGAVGIETNMSNSDQGQLNLKGINVIRVFQDGGRPYVYGARTTATDANWNYINVRRLFLFLEKSIQDSIRWAVFEPNNKALWAKLKQSISGFLLTQWQAGALFGDTPDKAYYVRIDGTLNTQTTMSQGVLNMEIGVVPTYPAEFIVVRIGIWDGGAVVTEG